MWQTGLYNNTIDNFKVEKPAFKSVQSLHKIRINGV